MGKHDLSGKLNISFSGLGGNESISLDFFSTQIFDDSFEDDSVADTGFFSYVCLSKESILWSIKNNLSEKEITAVVKCENKLSVSCRLVYLDFISSSDNYGYLAVSWRIE